MKIHANILAEVPNCWTNIFQKGTKDQLAIHEVLKSKKQWGSKDRKMFGDIMYELIRHFRAFALIGNTAEVPSLADPQLLVQGFLTFKNSDLTFEEFCLTNLPNATFAQKASIPDWVDMMGREDSGNTSWEEDVLGQSSEAPVCLRISGSVVQYKTALNHLLKLDPGLEAVSDSSVILSKRIDLSNDVGYSSGWYEIQDLGSQEISQIINPGMNEVIWDVCAGAGGKTLHLADLMKGKGKIIAMDVNESKLKSLVYRLKKSRFTNIEVKLNKANEPWNTDGIPNPTKIVIDAPCSGSGTWRRNPDSRWKTDQNTVEGLLDIQYKLLQMGIRNLSPQASLYYITCSILPKENQFQIRRIKEEFSNINLVNEVKIHPKNGGSDGFYLAELKQS